MLNNFNRTLLALLTLVMFFTGVVAPVLQTNAVLPVVDHINLWTRIANFAKTVANWLKTEHLKVLRDQIVKMMVNRITDDIVRSIANDGDPQYIQNWKSYLGEAADVAFNNLNDKLKTVGANLCAPFAPQIQAALRYRLNYPYGRIPVECSFNEFKQNLAYSQDFLERGGWLVYDQMLIPSNNYYGLSILASDEYYNNLQKEKTARQNEALASSGFLSNKKCKDEKAIEAAKKTCKGEADEKTCQETALKTTCQDWQIITPGDTVAQTVTSALNLKGQYVTNVQSIISALTNVLLQKVLDKAAGGLLGAVGNSGKTYTVDKNTKEQIDNVNKAQLDPIKKKYQETIDYVGGTLLPTISTELNQANTITCSTSTITYKDSDGNDITTTVGALQNFLSITKQGMTGAVADAQNGVTAIDNLSKAEDAQAAMQEIVNDYNDFIGRYSIIMIDLGTVSAGGTGSLERLYYNILQALQTFTCS